MMSFCFRFQIFRGVLEWEWVGVRIENCELYLSPVKFHSWLSGKIHQKLHILWLYVDPAKKFLNRSTKSTKNAFIIKYSPFMRFFLLLKKSLYCGAPGWLSGWASAFGSGHDPGVLGSSPTLGSLCGACFCLCLCLCPFLCLSWIKIKSLKIN